MDGDNIQIVCPGCASINRVQAQRVLEHPRCGRCKAALFSGSPIALDTAHFDRHVRNGDLPVVVDFWAPWCQPCRMMAPAFERAAGEFQFQARFAKVNTDEEPGLGSRFGIRGVPTLVIFQGGNEIARQAGAHDFASLVSWIRRHVSAR